MALSVRRNVYTTVESKETLSDASAGAFEEDSITFDICKEVVDEFFLTEEPQIEKTIRLMLTKERKLMEGAAAVAVAPLLEQPDRWKDQNSVVVICGGNISVDKLQSVLCSK